MGIEQSDFESDVITEDSIGTRKPRPFNVILYNDNYTSMEFVVEILEVIFHHTTAVATKLMQDVHNNGKAVAGTYTYEIAETKATEAMSLARRDGHPLKCAIEPAHD
ncbi:MAG: ATP-dependent Clp protease adaptor ClpS [Deltaproteobacteria bacterium]|nr:ATP-dependent Clp protease adaptor ClpS [Deltaproteobacteria bacterium]